MPIPPHIIASFDRIAQATGARLRCRPVVFENGDRPIAAACHANIDRWVLENPADQAVRGWVAEAQMGTSRLLVAHSVVRTEGELIDITLDCPYVFIPHEGPDEAFDMLRKFRAQIVWPPPAGLL